jgi:hypothetical protein
MCVQLGTNTFQEDMMQNLECKIKIRKIYLFFLIYFHPKSLFHLIHFFGGLEPSGQQFERKQFAKISPRSTTLMTTCNKFRQKHVQTLFFQLGTYGIGSDWVSMCRA